MTSAKNVQAVVLRQSLWQNILDNPDRQKLQNLTPEAIHMSGYYCLLPSPLSPIQRNRFIKSFMTGKVFLIFSLFQKIFQIKLSHPCFPLSRVCQPV